MKVRSVGAEFFRADGQTDMMKLIVTFRNFANAFKKDRPIRCRWGKEAETWRKYYVHNFMYPFPKF